MHMIGSLRPAFSPLTRTQAQLAFRPTPYSVGRIQLGQVATPAQLAMLENFNGLSLDDMLGLLKVTDVNVLVKGLGIDKALAFVASMVKKSGQMVSSALDTTYNKYKSTSKWSIGSWASKWIALSPATWTYIYFQGNAQHRAVAELAGIKELGTAWILNSTKTWFGGSPDSSVGWVDDYDVIDRADSDAVGATFSQVVASEARVIDLMVEVENLPEHAILSAVGIFWKELGDRLNATAKGIFAILKAIAALAEMLGRILVGAAKFTAAFPVVVLLGAAAFLIWKLS